MRRSGFTLLELSIVLVIIGLIIGGVTVGGELIHQAELQSVSKDFQKYDTAIITFQLKYRYLPGDLPTAYSYWPAAGNNGKVCTTGVNLNGDGDGFVRNQNWINNGEDSRSWQHLSLAGMIEGSLTGTYTATGVQYGTNLPPGRISGTGFNLLSHLDQTGCGTTTALHGWIPSRPGNFLLYSSRGDSNGLTGSAGKMWGGGSLTPADAQSLDAKNDDGIPQQGKLMGANYETGSGCYSGSAYTLAEPGKVCRLVYWLN